MARTWSPPRLRTLEADERRSSTWTELFFDLIFVVCISELAELLFHEISWVSLAAYAGLVPSTYSSGGKTYHGKIIKQGNKWLRWAFVEAVTPAIASDPQLRAQYEHLKIRGTNKARVAMARKLLTIAFQILRDQRAYEPRGESIITEGASMKSRLS